VSKYILHIVILFGLCARPMVSLSAEERLEIDFTLVEGRILINGHLSGHDGVFIFDTGTPEIIINDSEIGNNGTGYMSSVQGDHPVAIKAGIIGWSAFDADQPIFINYRDSKIQPCYQA